MLYNTQREPVRMKAYGREVQQMVEMALTIADRAERQAYAQRIMVVMRAVTQQLNPTQEESDKLWNHLAQLSDYRLDIDYPCEIKRHEEQQGPHKLAYPQQHPLLRHYGVIVQNLLNKALEKTDPQHLKIGIVTAAQRMREKLYEARGDMPTLERIAHDISLMTQGRISTQEALALIS